MTGHALGYRWFLVLSLALLAACASSAPVSDPAGRSGPAHSSASAAWSAGVVVGQAAHLGAPAVAPAVAPAGEGWAVVWADGPDLFFRLVAADGALGPPQTLHFDSRTPWNPALLPAPDGGWHLLWQDLDAFGDVQLYAARLAGDGALLRGRVTVTPQAISAAAVAPGDGGTVVIVWADASDRPALYGQRLDSQGRPGAVTAEPVARDAAWPALARTGAGGWVLAWLSGPGAARGASTARLAMARVGGSPLPWEGGSAPVTLGQIEAGAATAYVETVRLGLDQAYGYLFVSQRDAGTDTPRTDVFAFALGIPAAGAAETPAVARQEVTLPAAPPPNATDLITGFNTGPALALPADGVETAPVGWPAPAWGQFDALPVAFEMGGEVVVGYFRGGALAGYQPISLGARAGGALGLWSDRARHLTLAWANLPASGEGPASLLLSSTRSALREAASGQGVE